MIQKSVCFSVIIFLWALSVFCYRYEPNTLIVNDHTVCPNDDKNPVHLNISIAPIARNKYLVNGHAIFDEYLSGPLELQLISQRCDFNMTHCAVHDTLNIRDICKVMGLEEQFWSEFMKHVNPKVVCPFKKFTRLEIKNATVELGYLAHLPLDGYTWIFTEKVFKTVKGRKRKQMVFCVEFQITIEKYRPGRNKN